MRHFTRRHIECEVTLSLGNGQEIKVKDVIMTTEELKPFVILGKPCKTTGVISVDCKSVNERGD